MMKLVSYAQNNEDILLWRALKNIKKGFYIDVGACYPEIGSVTKIFYDSGWKGINIEPHPKTYEEVSEQRPHHISLNIAITDKSGTQTLHVGESVGESSLLGGAEGGQTFETQTMTLEQLCEEYVTQPIDFLKVDAEGSDYVVIESGNWKKYRPKVVICEVTLPWSNNKSPDAEKINNFLSDNDYHMVYFDGINHYYVANECSELDPALSYQPNVLDDFISHAELLRDEKVTKRFTSKIEKTESWLESMNAWAKQLEKQLKKETLNTAKIEACLNEEKAKSSEIEIRLNEEVVKSSLIEEHLNEERAKSLEIETRLNEEMAKSSEIEVRLNEEMTKSSEIEEQLKKETLNTAKIETFLNEEKAKSLEIEVRLNEEVARSSEIDMRLNEEIAKSSEIESHYKKLYNNPLALTALLLRIVSSNFQRLLNFAKRLFLGILRIPKRMIRYVLVKSAPVILKQPLLKKVGLKCLSYFPKLKSRLQQLIHFYNFQHVTIDESALAEKQVVRVNNNTVDVLFTEQLTRWNYKNDNG